MQSNWAQDYEDASEDLKLVLTKAPVLRRLDSSLTYVLYTDWSSPTIGAVLEQTGQDGKQPPVTDGSRMLRGAELRRAPTQGECFTEVHWLQHFRHYGMRFILEVDHWDLKGLITSA